MVGTPDYLAPEQALDFHQADIRADLYSLGCTLFFLLTGQPPFPGGNLAQKLNRHQYDEPPALDRFRSDLPPMLGPIVERMLAKDPSQRYQTPQEFLHFLAGARATSAPSETIGQGKPRSRSQGRRWAAVLAATILTGAAFWLANRLNLATTPSSTARTDAVSASAPTRALRRMPLTALHATGISPDGKPLADGAVDPHWVLLRTPAGPTRAPAYVTINAWPVGTAWLANTRREPLDQPAAQRKGRGRSWFLHLPDHFQPCGFRPRHCPADYPSSRGQRADRSAPQRRLPGPAGKRLRFLHFADDFPRLRGAHQHARFRCPEHRNK